MESCRKESPKIICHQELKKGETKGMEWYGSIESVLALDLAFNSSTNDYLCTYHL